MKPASISSKHSSRDLQALRKFLNMSAEQVALRDVNRYQNGWYAPEAITRLFADRCLLP
jgi:hypothetical protein